MPSILESLTITNIVSIIVRYMAQYVLEFV